MEKAITNTTKESHTNAANATKVKKRRPAFPKVARQGGGLFNSFLTASEFESPQLEKSAFCIFFVRLSPEASNYLDISFFTTFQS